MMTTMDSAASEARRALNRLRRALEKADRELKALSGALVHAEGDDFPGERYGEVREALRLALDFTEEEEVRLREKILHAGGLEPGRVRRG
jgi:Cdc6-like AAA superfamily ATPase